MASRAFLARLIQGAALVSLAALAGCETNRDSVVVGSIPDDYRTNHPIIIKERDQVLDLPVGASEHGMTQVQRVRFDGFIANYDRETAPVLTVMAPSGGLNHVAAQQAARELGYRAQKRGVPPGRIAVTSYPAPAADTSPPIRIVYAAMRAGVEKCGRWPADLNSNLENKNYANFGCASQNNLAMQVANPADLLGPRQQTEIDAENRSVAIDRYRNGTRSLLFRGQSEVDTDF
ncbi:MAG: CpaD family pilus assembly protein [Methylobacterium mesophilicum]|nr:CpaD family pilus assembly protein [Methylobacterium mesophilicum]